MRNISLSLLNSPFILPSRKQKKKKHTETHYTWCSLLLHPLARSSLNQTCRKNILGNKSFNPLTPELNPSAQRCLTRFFTSAFAHRTLHFVNICVKTNKYTNYSFSLLIMYGSSYMFRHYIAIIRELSYCLMRDAQLRSSR
jgi:hypothetical protein